MRMRSGYERHTELDGMLDEARKLTAQARSAPREEAVEPGGHTLLVSNFQSGQLEAVDVSRLP